MSATQPESAGTTGAICEVVLTSMSTPAMAGPFMMNFTFLWLNAVIDGCLEKPTVMQKQAGGISQKEIGEVLEKGMECLVETPERRDALEALCDELTLDHWVPLEPGSYWFSRRFAKA